MSFNVQEAKKAGYNDDEILQHLTETRKFDIDGAVNSGWKKTDIIDYLSKNQPLPSAPKKPDFGLSKQDYQQSYNQQVGDAGKTVSDFSGYEKFGRWIGAKATSLLPETQETIRRVKEAGGSAEDIANLESGGVSGNEALASAGNLLLDILTLGAGSKIKALSKAGKLGKTGEIVTKVAQKTEKIPSVIRNITGSAVEGAARGYLTGESESLSPEEKKNQTLWGGVTGGVMGTIGEIANSILNRWVKPGATSRNAAQISGASEIALEESRKNYKQVEKYIGDVQSGKISPATLQKEVNDSIIELRKEATNKWRFDTNEIIQNNKNKTFEMSPKLTNDVKDLYSFADIELPSGLKEYFPLPNAGLNDKQLAKYYTNLKNKGSYSFGGNVGVQIMADLSDIKKKANRAINNDAVSIADKSIYKQQLKTIKNVEDIMDNTYGGLKQRNQDYSEEMEFLNELTSINNPGRVAENAVAADTAANRINNLLGKTKENALNTIRELDNQKGTDIIPKLVALSTSENFTPLSRGLHPLESFKSLVGNLTGAPFTPRQARDTMRFIGQAQDVIKQGKEKLQKSSAYNKIPKSLQPTLTTNQNAGKLATSGLIRLFTNVANKKNSNQ